MSSRTITYDRRGPCGEMVEIAPERQARRESPIGAAGAALRSALENLWEVLFMGRAEETYCEIEGGERPPIVVYKHTGMNSVQPMVWGEFPRW